MKMADSSQKESVVSFINIIEPRHETSHLCFGRRKPSTLLSLEAAALISVLEDTVNQLNILNKLLPVDKNEVYDEQFKDVDKRFGKPPRSPRIYRELAGLWPSDTEILLKIQKDRAFVENTLQEALQELKNRGGFSVLRSALDWQLAMEADEAALLSNASQRKEDKIILLKQLETEKNRMTNEEANLDQKTEFLSTTLQDQYLITGLTLDWVKNWEQTRREQHNLLLDREEDAIQDSFENVTGPDVISEECAHEDIKHFLGLEHEELKKELDHWADVYDEEMNQRETDLIRLKNSIEFQSETHLELQAENHRRHEIMELAVKLQKEFEMKQRAINNVVAIQAWWRGVSFRHGLTGKTKKKGKKGKGSKKQKKKKKK